VVAPPLGRGRSRDLSPVRWPDGPGRAGGLPVAADRPDPAGRARLVHVAGVARARLRRDPPGRRRRRLRRPGRRRPPRRPRSAHPSARARPPHPPAPPPAPLPDRPHRPEPAHPPAHRRRREAAPRPRPVRRHVAGAAGAGRRLRRRPPADREPGPGDAGRAPGPALAGRGRRPHHRQGAGLVTAAARYADPEAWALTVLGLAGPVPGRKDVQRRFRELLRVAHPDHGGGEAAAAERIAELTEARRILLAS
jgi:hypothetical protein